MLAVVEVAERKLAGIKVGEPAEVRLVTGETRKGKIRFVSKTASQATRTYRVEVEIAERRRRHPGRHHRRGRVPLAPVAGDARAALGADLLVERRPRRARGDADGIVAFVPIGVVEDEQTAMWVSGIADGTRVIVQGQDFVREGQKVEPVAAAEAARDAALDRRRDSRRSMSDLIDYAIGHARLTIATLIFLLLAGFVAYVTIPKEAEPDVKIPIIYVQLSQRGISPEDAERLLLRPVETQLKSVGNVKEMRSTAFEGGGYVLLEFEAGFDSKAALADVRAKVDQAKHDLPRDVDEPQVLEVNLSLYPVLVVGALRRPAGAHAAAHRARRRRTRSSRRRACCRPSCAARATRRSRSSSIRC